MANLLINVLSEKVRDLEINTKSIFLDVDEIKNKTINLNAEQYSIRVDHAKLEKSVDVLSIIIVIQLIAIVATFLIIL